MDCGVDPGTSGPAGLPFLGDVNPEEVDIIFITYVAAAAVGPFPLR